MPSLSREIAQVASSYAGGDERFDHQHSIRAQNTGGQHAVMPSLSWEIAQVPSSSYAGRDERFVHSSTECPRREHG
jgi:hypothetical protein